MDLKELKKEVMGLQNTSKTITQFQNSWLQPFHKGAPLYQPFFSNVPVPARAQINQKLALAYGHLSEIKKHQAFQGKLHQVSHSLVDLKLSLLQDNPKRAKIIAKQLLSGEELSVKQLLTQAQEFEERVQALCENYHEVNDLLHHHLSLEEAIYYMEMPHYTYLRHLVSTAQNQKRIVRDLGRHLVVLTKDASLRNYHK